MNSKNFKQKKYCTKEEVEKMFGSLDPNEQLIFYNIIKILEKLNERIDILEARASEPCETRCQNDSK